MSKRKWENGREDVVMFCDDGLGGLEVKIHTFLYSSMREGFGELWMGIN